MQNLSGPASTRVSIGSEWRLSLRINGGVLIWRPVGEASRALDLAESPIEEIFLPSAFLSRLQKALPGRRKKKAKSG